MPMLHYSQHAYGTWMPGKARGYVHHSRGLQPSSDLMDRQYRLRQREPDAVFTPDVQECMINTLLDSQQPLDLLLFSVGTDPEHVHVAFCYRDDRRWDAVCRSLKQSLTRRLNKLAGRRT